MLKKEYAGKSFTEQTRLVLEEKDVSAVDSLKDLWPTWTPQQETFSVIYSALWSESYTKKEISIDLDTIYAEALVSSVSDIGRYLELDARRILGEVEGGLKITKLLVEDITGKKIREGDESPGHYLREAGHYMRSVANYVDSPFRVRKPLFELDTSEKSLTGALNYSLLSQAYTHAARQLAIPTEKMNVDSRYRSVECVPGFIAEVYNTNLNDVIEYLKDKGFELVVPVVKNGNTETVSWLELLEGKAK